jgi:hypothetical protein
MPHATTRFARLAATLLTLAAVLVWLPAGAQAAVGHGLCVSELDNSIADPAAKAQVIAEIANELNTGWVRLIASWPSIEPTQGQYNEAVLTYLDDTIAKLHERGVKVVLTFLYVPRWASDTSYWDSPPGGIPAGYSVRYPMRDGALDDMGATAEMLATRYAGLVKAYECWNEPNLWPYIYPQRTASDEYFGARTYLKYLKAFSAGVERGDPAALVVAGSTAPIGLNDRFRTSPQKFARFLKGAGAGSYFDVYSHHPYIPGGSVNKAPDQPPNDSTTTVTLYNLNTLLRLFPAKPFYLTEYGYNTQPSRDFGGQTVTKVQQATYLKKAYAYAGRYSQVKNLFWFLVKDVHGEGQPADVGVYTGLRELDGDRKLSWFAFAGGNRLTIEAPRTARYGAVIRISGTLSNAVVGPLGGRTLVLQSRKLSGGAWRTVSSKTTGDAGAYRFSVKPGGSRAYRVVWRGVKTSVTRTVRVYL